MKLTGKCFDDFGDKCEYQYDDFLELPEVCQNALIIEWLDSVGILILISYGRISKSWMYNVLNETDNFLSSRSQATNAAIEKANELYNKSL